MRIFQKHSIQFAYQIFREIVLNFWKRKFWTKFHHRLWSDRRLIQAFIQLLVVCNASEKLLNIILSMMECWMYLLEEKTSFIFFNWLDKHAFNDILNRLSGQILIT